MRYITYLLLLLFNNVTVAQVGYYIHPSFSVGQTNLYGSNLRDKSPSTGMRTNYPQFELGYQYQKFFATMGIGFLQTGRETAFYFSYFDKNVSGQMRWARKSEVYEHIMIPISLGYKLQCTEKFAIISALGTPVSYNTSATYSIIENYEPENMPYTEPFNKPYSYKGNDMIPFNRISIWGLLKADLDYMIGPDLSFCIGASVCRMLTNIAKSEANTTHGFPRGMHNQAILFNAGITIRLSGSYNGDFRKYGLSSCEK